MHLTQKCSFQLKYLKIFIKAESNLKNFHEILLQIKNVAAVTSLLNNSRFRI